MPNELILIVEDNEKNRKLCRDVLQVKGYRTIESETAEDGLKLAAEKSPALILMDIQLPGMDGITAMKQLKADAAPAAIPMVEPQAAQGVDPAVLQQYQAQIEQANQTILQLQAERDRLAQQPAAPAPRGGEHENEYGEGSDD